MRKFRKLILVAFLMIFAILPITMVVGDTIVRDDELTVRIDITDAYYTALDEDNTEDDIVAHFDMEIRKNGRKISNDRQKFDLYVELILPSETSYIFGFRLFCRQSVSISPEIHLNNLATEPGWYRIVLTCVLFDGSFVTSIGSEDLIFDPPGSTPGTEPGTCSIILY